VFRLIRPRPREINRKAPSNLPELPADPPAPTAMETIMAEMAEPKKQRSMMEQATMELRRTRVENLQSTSALQAHKIGYQEEYDVQDEYDPSTWNDFDDPGVDDFAYLEADYDAPGLDQFHQDLVAEIESLKKAKAEQQAEALLEEESDGVRTDLIKEDMDLYQDPKGQSVTTQLAKHVTQIWSKGTDMKRVKEVSAKLPMPENIAIKPVDLNQEVQAGLDKFTLARDRRLRLVQALSTRALVPFTRIAHMAMRPEDLDRKCVLDTALDGVLMLAAASAAQNSIRRDVIRPKLGPKYKQLCGEVDCLSPLLLGEDMAARIKQTQASVNILGRGRGQFGTFRGTGQWFTPYGRGQGYGNMGGFRRYGARVFLGKLPSNSLAQTTSKTLFVDKPGEATWYGMAGA
jgi:hypothetical protein